MQRRLLEFIRKHRLFDKKDKLVVAVSGGTDSMVLLWLLHSSGFTIVAAHCNFNLRPPDCDEDQRLVEDFCRQNHIPCYTKSFHTMRFAKENKLSVEMAARKLRYNWFEQLRQTINARYIATAHHANDNVETVMLNIVRGTGLKGLTGIHPKNGYIVRPLLWADRQTLEALAKINNIPFRTDQTNYSDSIPRNRIRMHVVPNFELINPSFLKTMRQNIAVWNDYYTFASQHLSSLIQTVVKEKENLIYFDLKNLSSPETQRLILFQTFQNLGFDSQIAAESLKILNSQPGTRIKTKTHVILHNRDSILIKPLVVKNSQEVLVQLTSGVIETPISLKISICQYSGQEIAKTNSVATIDLEKITPPLLLRPWKAGDRFMPLGMTNVKKLSDFLTDLKLSPDEKSSQWVLCDQRQIVWVVGRRIDNRCRVDKNTKTVVILQLLK